MLIPTLSKAQLFMLSHSFCLLRPVVSFPVNITLHFLFRSFRTKEEGVCLSKQNRKVSWIHVRKRLSVFNFSWSVSFTWFQVWKFSMWTLDGAVGLDDDDDNNNNREEALAGFMTQIQMFSIVNFFLKMHGLVFICRQTRQCRKEKKQENLIKISELALKSKSKNVKSYQNHFFVVEVRVRFKD